ncbi:hypothetical protein E2P81_ATG03809 [Venturia nashicola]|uniref:Uncharacterized protein n=1 Tax=Venturia nashicola TaxID=86259 RepID=A0A4Z1PT77_9PEZI|nr:hypothetical protein E6O75_ATG03897 [Venturia nashicola]TLD38134.1 hypothetical protein E2P81_ATG03809 [Venturia nashicola]
MVQLTNFLTIMVAASGLVEANNARQAASASAQAEAKDAIASFQNILTALSGSIGSEEQLGGEELKTAFQGYMRMLQGVANINQQMPANLVSAANATPFQPNWEGAAIGAVGLALPALIGGTLMGVTTQWSFSGLNRGIRDMTGFDIMEIVNSGALTGGGFPLTALAGGAAGPSKPASPHSPSAPKPMSPPVVAAPAPQSVSSPGSPAPPALTVPGTPSVPASPASPPKPDAPPPMPGMGHGGMRK